MSQLVNNSDNATGGYAAWIERVEKNRKPANENIRELTRFPHLLAETIFRPISDVQSVAELLTFKRPAGSDTEKRFIAMYLDGVPGMQRDEVGNRYVLVTSNKVQHPSVMFSSHTDTVHRTAGMQTLSYDTVKHQLFSNSGECLGADDGAGVYVMLRMIEAKVPGLYVFHRQEEIGGHGSTYFSKTQRDKLMLDIKQVVAFDRKGQKSIITYQSGDRTTSDEYAIALGMALQMGHVPDEHGLFTDSINYAHYVPECTNISVGYERAHTSDEYLDTAYLERLVAACIAVDWEALPIKRDPLVIDELPGVNYGRGHSGVDWGDMMSGKKGKSEKIYTPTPGDDDLPTIEELEDLVDRDPQGVAEVLYYLRLSWGEIADAMGLHSDDTVQAFQERLARDHDDH